MPQDVSTSLKSVARRFALHADEADDLVQDALLAAIEAGRTDFSSARTRAWLAGVVRNKARMAGRSAARRRAREEAWASVQPGEHTEAGLPIDFESLPPSLRLVALLAANGATRAEIAWLLGLKDTALRQRISQLKRALASREESQGAELQLSGALPFGVLRRSMVERLKARGGFLASHDPDGHFFVLARSQNEDRRQHPGELA